MAEKAAAAQRKSPRDQLDEVPESSLPRAQRRKLEKLCAQLDQIGRVDGRGTVYISEKQLRVLFRTDESTAGMADDLIALAKELPHGEKVRKQEAAGDRAIGIIELGARLGIPDVPENETLEGYGLTPASTPAEARAAFKTRHPRAPEWLFEPQEAEQKTRQVVEKLRSAPAPIAGAGGLITARYTEWDCIKDALGLWLLLVFSVFVHAMILTAGNLMVSLIAAGFSIPLWAIIIVVICIVTVP